MDAMDTLFTEMENERKSEVAPLAVRMRPRSLDELVGQDEAVGLGSWLRNAIEQDRLSLGHPVRPGGHGQDVARAHRGRDDEGHVRGGVGHRRHGV